MGYKEDLEIDKYSLDTEWQNQSLKFANWAEKHVEALFEKDKCKEQLEIVRAQTDHKIRTSVTEKITETAISNKVTLDPEYMKANSAYLEAIKTAGILGVGREAFDHRKKALEKMTDLFLSNYWADKGVHREDKNTMDKINQEGVQKTFQESMSIRRRKAIQNND